MLTQDCKVVWYGKLKVDSKATPVMYDPLLSPSIKGCIYLYNSERDTIVQYTWDIVRGLLVDVDNAEKTKIKKAFDAKWKSARKRFTRGREYAITSHNKAPIPVLPSDKAEQRWDAPDDDNFELEDLG